MTRRPSITELAGVYCPSTSRHKVMFMLQAYFDESGVHPTSPGTVVAGYIAKLEAWAPFESDWNALLAKHSHGEFHASHIWTASGDAAGRNRNLTERESIVREFAEVIVKHGLTGIACAVNRGAWDKSAAPHIKKRMLSPYGLAIEVCIQSLARWSQDNAGSDPVAMVFDDRQEGRIHFDTVWDAYVEHREKANVRIIQSLNFSSAKITVPLQAADLFSYEIYQYISKPENRRPILDYLTASKVVGFRYYGDEELHELSSRTPIVKIGLTTDDPKKIAEATRMA